MAPKRGKWPSPGGKAPRGRPTAPRGKLRDFLPTPAAMNVPANGFSMKDEARNTASHQSSLGWLSGDAKLRQRPVAFVSAGLVEPLKDETASDKPSDLKSDEKLPEVPEENAASTAEAGKSATPGIKGLEILEVEATSKIVEQETVVAELPVPDECVGDADQVAENQGTEPKELFFFDLGEGQPTVDLSIPPPKFPSPRSSFGGSDSSEEVILFRGRTADTRGPVGGNKRPRSNIAAAPSKIPVERGVETTPENPDQPASSQFASPSGFHCKRSRSRRNRSQAAQVAKDDEEDAILADYIANMAANSEDDFLESQLQAFPGHRDLGGDDDAVDFGSGDEKSPNGDDFLDNEGAEYVVSGSSDAEQDDFTNGDDDDMDADMDDETLARLLAKQEELGIGCDERLLFSSSFAQTGTRKAKGKLPAKARYGPASATQVADAFDNLDLADWDHLTGQTRKRRSKQPPNFNISDSEIEAALKAAWTRDRDRKKSRKLEREALRAEGLLSKNASPDDLRVKYLSGMKLDDMKTELTSFLLSSTERLEFPPLDKHARKVLHEIASKFNIKSQSTGKGDQRRPVLYRTNRTVRYASTRIEDATMHVDQAALRVHRKYFHRVDVKVQRTESPRAAGGGRSGHKALTLREGEIVGASVPELGQENKGRNMLEKMGWSKGMALGALDNKGILEPVAQVMKRSKAGLG